LRKEKKSKKHSATTGSGWVFEKGEKRVKNTQPQQEVVGCLRKGKKE
jgi:hypothetical protein